MRELAEQTFLGNITASCALVDGSGAIYYLHGKAGMFLEPETGAVGSYNILKMAREGLKYDLAGALRMAVRNKRTESCTGLQVKTNGNYTVVDLSICPADTMANDLNLPDLYLVIFQNSNIEQEKTRPEYSLKAEVFHGDIVESFEARTQIKGKTSSKNYRGDGKLQ